MPAPWSRAPFMIWRQPSVVLAVAAAALLVALPAASASLFLSASGNATLQQQLSTSCEWLNGAQWTGTLPMAARPDLPPGPVGEKLLDERVQTAKSATAGAPGLSAPVVTLIGGASVFPPKGAAVQPDQTILRLFSRDGFAAHLQVLSGGTGRGIWLPDGFAATQRLKVGDQVVLAAGADPITMPVAAVFRDLRTGPDQPYWCSLRDAYRGKPLSEAPVYPVGMLSQEDMLAVGQGNGQLTNQIEESVDARGLTTANAGPVVDGLQRARMASAADGSVLSPDAHVDFVSTLSGLVDRSRLVSSALTGTVVPLGAAGALAGLVIAAAAGSFWVDRRRSELAVLSTRGVGPWALMGKAVLELAAVVVLGAALGWLAARYLVASFGPSPLVTPGAIGGSVLGAAAALLATLGVIAVTSGRRVAKLFDVRTRRAKRWPWELVPLAGAVLAWFLLGDGTDVGTGAAGSVARIPPRLIVVPILVIVGLAMLAGRLIRWALARARPVPMRLPVLFLAWRRIVAVPAAAAILIGATAVPVALSVYATTVTGSVERTLRAEAQLLIGTDVVLGLTAPASVPPKLAGQASIVERWDAGTIGGTTVNLLGVNPKTFAQAAFWDSELAGPSLQDLMARLSAPGGPVGVLTGLATGGTATLRADGNTLDLAIVDVPQLPGKNAGYPLMLLRQDVLDRLVTYPRQQLWVRGDPSRISTTGLAVATTSQAQDVTASGVYSAITYTFAFLAAVSLLAGAIVMVGLLLYLNARARARRSAYVLLRRMGIGPRAHWRALLVEVGGLLLAGFAVGLALAAIVVALTQAAYDINPTMPPGTLVEVPWALAGELAAAAVVATVLATLAAQRAVAHARPAEVLRDTH
jgi:putative ABC transport system permease protein